MMNLRGVEPPRYRLKGGRSAFELQVRCSSTVCSLSRWTDLSFCSPRRAVWVGGFEPPGLSGGRVTAAWAHRCSAPTYLHVHTPAATGRAGAPVASGASSVARRDRSLPSTRSLALPVRQEEGPRGRCNRWLPPLRGADRSPPHHCDHNGRRHSIHAPLSSPPTPDTRPPSPRAPGMAGA